MKWVMTALMLGFLFMFMQFYSLDRETDGATHLRLKYGLNRAAHDASLQIDPVALGQGNIRFLQDKALQVFQQTIRENLQLKANFTPLESTLLKDPIQIIYQDYIDDTSGVTFPYIYENKQMNIFKVIRGPAVVFKVRVKLPRNTAFSYDGYIYKHVIFEYPLP